MNLPEGAREVIDTLEKAGFEAYVVGGCVRDSLLGRVPDDWDITTSAMPEQVKELFRRTVDTGIKHGTVTVLVEREGYEVTTYRIDGEYEDGRHPKEVSFTRNLREDLLRRDFTINAMAYSPSKGLVDIFGGTKDLAAGVIRCVGNPMARFGEDALRILRAVRFSAQLGFEIEPETEVAMKELAPTLKKISEERIQVELSKLLCSGQPEKIMIAYETGITRAVLSEFDRITDEERRFAVRMLGRVEENHILRWTAFFWCMDEDTAKQALRRLKFDNHTICMVTHLIHFKEEEPEMEMEAVRRSVCKVGTEYYPVLLAIKEAELDACAEPEAEEKKRALFYWKETYQAIAEQRQCVSLKQLKINGKELMALGIPQGKQMGEMLAWLLSQVLTHPEWNEKERLSTMAKEKCEANGERFPG